jgi:hypothetical protein
MDIAKQKQSVIERFGFSESEKGTLEATLRDLSPQDQKNTLKFIENTLGHSQGGRAKISPSTLYQLVEKHSSALTDPAASAEIRDAARQQIIKRFNRALLFGDLWGELSNAERVRIIHSGVRVVGARLLEQRSGTGVFPKYWEVEWGGENAAAGPASDVQVGTNDSHHNRQSQAPNPDQQLPSSGDRTAEPRVTPFNHTILLTRLEASPIAQGEYKMVFDTLRYRTRITDLLDLANVSAIDLQEALRGVCIYRGADASSSHRDFAQDFLSQIANTTTPPSAALALLMAPLSDESLWRDISQNTRTRLGAIPIYPAAIHAGRVILNELLTPLWVDNGLRLWQLLSDTSRQLQQDAKCITAEERASIVEVFNRVGITIRPHRAQAQRPARSEGNTVTHPSASVPQSVKPEVATNSPRVTSRRQPRKAPETLDVKKDSPEPNGPKDKHTVAPGHHSQAAPNVRETVPSASEGYTSTATPSPLLDQQIFKALASKLDDRRWLDPDLIANFKSLKASYVLALGNLDSEQLEQAIRSFMLEKRCKTTPGNAQPPTKEELRQEIENFYASLQIVGDQTLDIGPLLVASLDDQKYWTFLSQSSRDILAGYTVHRSMIKSFRLCENVLSARAPVNNGLRLLQFVVLQSAPDTATSTSQNLVQKLTLSQRQKIHATFKDSGIGWSELDWLLDEAAS